MFNIVTDKEKISQYFSVFFSECGGRFFERTLKSFLKREGVGHNIIFIYFKEDLDEEPEDLPVPLDDQHILIEFTFMGDEERNIAYIDFSTFYSYVYQQALLEQEATPSLNVLSLVEELKFRLLGE